jgi:hypothetical protein
LISFPRCFKPPIEVSSTPCITLATVLTRPNRHLLVLFACRRYIFSCKRYILGFTVSPYDTVPTGVFLCRRAGEDPAPFCRAMGHRHAQPSALPSLLLCFRPPSLRRFPMTSTSVHTHKSFCRVYVQTLYYNNE